MARLRRLDPRGVSIRWLLSVGTIFVGTVGACVCLSLVLLSGLLHKRIGDMVVSLHSVSLASGLEGALLLHRSSESLTNRGVQKANLYNAASEAGQYVQTQEEQAVLDGVHHNLGRYLDEPKNERAFADAIASTRQLADINLRQAKEAELKAADFDGFARLLGVTAAALLGMGILFAIWWLRHLVFDPILRIDDALGKFSSGDLDARAEVTGADELRRLSALFNEMALSLGVTRLNQLRYLGAVVDELRNPLTALQLGSEYVSPTHPLPPEARVRELFELFRRQIRVMASIVGDVLNTAAIEAGDLELSHDRCAAGEMAKEAVEEFRQLAPQHHIDLQLPDEEVPLICDQVRVSQVLNNLLNNAIQFSPRGSTVRVRVDRLDDGQVQFSVSDEGMGIPLEERTGIFKPFQHRPGAHHEASGVGLGLYVSRRIVEAHGGRLELSSGLGKGSLFTMVLPLQPSAEQPRPGEAVH